jgi:translation elongation factor EF-Tu-like GTPase
MRIKTHLRAMLIGSVNMDFSPLILKGGQDWLAPSTKEHILRTGRTNVTIMDN